MLALGLAACPAVRPAVASGKTGRQTAACRALRPSAAGLAPLRQPASATGAARPRRARQPPLAATSFASWTS